MGEAALGQGKCVGHTGYLAQDVTLTQSSALLNKLSDFTANKNLSQASSQIHHDSA